MTARLFVDSHCHLDRYPDPGAALTEAERAGVVTIAVSETPSEFERYRATVADSRFLRLAVGLHPLRIGGLQRREIERFFALLGQVDYVGEIGIDLSPAGRPTARRQIAVFERLLGHPSLREKILTVHSRGAAKETVERLSSAGAQAILHWYSGSLTVADSALSSGFYFSVNSPMTRSRTGRRLLERLPRDRVITETDGPFAKHNGRPSRPSDVPEIVAQLARLWGGTIEDVAYQVVGNLSRLYAETRSDVASDRARAGRGPAGRP